jgi:hypothetical protein
VKTCEVCGQRVKLYRGKEGTNSYEPVAETELRQALEAVRVMREEMQRASRFLDSIKYELNCSVYTVTDDEFDRVFGARDFLNEALAHPSVQAAVAQLEKDGLSRSGASRDDEKMEER